MNRTTARILLVACCSAWSFAAAMPSSEAMTPAPQGAMREHWAERLASLDPIRPLEYLELAEEVADAAESDEERRLAAELFGLAGALDTARFGQSAMLGLSMLAQDSAERERTRAGAAMLGARGASADRVRSDAGAMLDDADTQAVDALGRAFSAHRRGDGRRALNALRQARAEELLEAVGPRLPGGAAAFRDECRAMRSGGGPLADDATVRQQHLVELALRRGAGASLGVEMALTGDLPLVEIDLSDPVSVWRVDPRRPWWRDGVWTASR
jgi:hypothetical protein